MKINEKRLIPFIDALIPIERRKYYTITQINFLYEILIVK